MTVELLDHPVYSVHSAAELLRVSLQTLRRWLDGDSKRSGEPIEPIIRCEPTGSEEVTWGEFVEATLLCEYRRRSKVSLTELRRFVIKMREKEGVQYPLAYSKPLISVDNKLLLTLQKSLNLPDELWLVVYASEQLLLAPAAAAFYRRLDWEAVDEFVDDKFAAAWKPHDDAISPVRCRPTHRFGLPSIKGISTEAIFEHVAAGESEIVVAEEFGLEKDEVCWACSYERSRPARKAA